MDATKAAWEALRRLAPDTGRPGALRGLFDADPGRFGRFSLRFDDLLVDFSKQFVTEETMAALRRLARLSGLEARRDAMLSGARVNATEGRAALHTALRAPPGAVVEVDGANVVPWVHGVLDRVCAFAAAVRAGAETGATGRAFADIVHLGTGGSALGPAAVVRALAPRAGGGPRVQFVGNADGTELADALRGLDPARVLFLVASKTFATAETTLNAESARRWIADALGEGAAGAHFAAITAAPERAAAFGVAPERIFPTPDWAGGRYSLWSAIGLPIAIAAGPERFRELLAGARRMDEHFAAAPPEANIPVALGLVGVWNRSVLGFASSAVFPYEARLSGLAAHLQQVEMESNGKSAGIDGAKLDGPAGGVLWGGVGTDAQHSVFQFLHQGSDIVPCEFLAAAEADGDLPGHRGTLLAACLAQSEALMSGRPADAGAPHRAFPGNRPSTTLLCRRFDARTLGAVLALYEHKTFVQSVPWGVNAFDQWGVELGKERASRLLPAVEGGAPPEDTDGSTRGLLAHLAALRGGRPPSPAR